MEKWTALLARLDLSADEYSTIRIRILDAIELLRHKTVHREPLEIDALWYSMKLPELLGDWHRAFEMQQVFKFVRGDLEMEVDIRKAIDQLLFGPQSPPTTLLQAYTWLQYSLEELCFRFVQHEHPALLEERKWEWPEQS